MEANILGLTQAGLLYVFYVCLGKEGEALQGRAILLHLFGGLISPLRFSKRATLASHSKLVWGAWGAI